MSQIQNGYVWTSGEICTADHLNQMLNSATLNAEAVSGQTSVASAMADTVLLFQNSSGELRQATVADILQTPNSTLKPDAITPATSSGNLSITTGGGNITIDANSGGASLQGAVTYISGTSDLSIVGVHTHIYGHQTSGDVQSGVTITSNSYSGGDGTGVITLQGDVTVTGKNNIMPTGCVMLFANATVPTGWAKCNGQAVSRTSSTYHDLFLAIGTIYGSGDGVNTFNLPDLRGEFVRGWDDGRGVDTGRAIGTHQDQQLEKHKHISSNTDCQSYASVNGTGTGTSNYFCDTTGVATGAGASLTGDGGHIEQTAKLGTETRPRNTAMMYCIKL